MKKIRKQKISKGFTLVELLGVIAILAVIVTISVPVFNKVKKTTLEKQYKNVVTTIETAAEKYAKETYITKVSVEDLIGGGYLSADDQEKIYNPIDKSSLNCYMVVTKNENGVYLSEFKEDENLIDKNNNACKKYENTYDVHICVVGETNCSDDSSKWYNRDVVLNVKLPKDVDLATVSYEWTSTVGDNFTTPTINVGADSLKTATYTVSVNYKKGDKVFTGKTSKEIKIDKQKPTIDLEVSNENVWSKDKTITANGIDGIGSGIKGYLFFNDINVTCPVNLDGYKVKNSINVSQNQNYKICVADNSGNISDIKNDRLNIKFIDIEVPNLAINFDKDNLYIRTKTLKFTATDKEALSYYEIIGESNNNIVNKKLNGVKTSTEEYTFANDGEYTIYLYDVAGRSVNRKVIVDSVVPYLTSSSMGSNSINANWNEVNLKQYFYTSSSSSIPSKGSLSESNSFSASCGTNYYGFVYAIDRAGNESPVIAIPGSYYYSCPSYDYDYDWGSSSSGSSSSGSSCDDACRINELSHEVNNATSKADRDQALKEAQDIRDRNDWETSNSGPGTHTVDKNGNCITWCN